jgi:hypothetical protein
MAQGKVDVSAGYNLLHFSNQTYPAGWYADVAGKVTPMFSVVGQVSGNYKSVDFTGGSVDLKLHTFMAGVRVNAPVTSGLSPYGQVLFGAARTTSSTNLTNTTYPTGSVSSNDGALQLGGGVQYKVANVGVQTGVDYMRIYSYGGGSGGVNVFRFAAGVVFGF